ncbi:PAC2 family protein [soil metagenome]
MVSRPYELIERPDLDSPLLIVALEGWIDAGLGAGNAVASLLEQLDANTVAVFDADSLLDHRARRPTMHLIDGVNTGLTWPSIELRSAVDPAGNDLLLLVGAEPDHQWQAFTGAVVDLVVDLGARMALGLGAYPAATPHTRSTRLSITAGTEELADSVGYLRGTIDVPAGVQAAIEQRCAEVGLPAVGLWAQVPHYAAAMPYAAASAALLEGLNKVGHLTLDTSALDEEATATRTRLDALVGDNPEHQQLVAALEEQHDAMDSSTQGPLPSGDELAAQFQRFLRDNDERS